MMRNLFLASVLLVLCAPYPALAGNKTWDPNVSVSVRVWSRYAASMGAVFHEEPVVQTDIFIALPEGFYADLWFSAGLDDGDLSSNFGDELDLTLGWSGTVNGFLVDTGVMYFDLYEVGSSDGPIGDALQPYLDVSRVFSVQKHVFSPYIRLEPQLPLRGETEGGYYLHGGIRHAWRPSGAITVSQELGLLYDNGAYGFERTEVLYYEASCSWDVGSGLVLEFPNVKASSPLSSLTNGRQPIADGRDQEAVYGAGVSYRF